MRLLRHQISRVIIGIAMVSASASITASAQTCLGVDACLLSPTRADAGRPINVNGCSVPPQAGALGQFWASVFESACNLHDADWATFHADVAGGFTQSNLAFRTRMLAICQARTDLPAAQCMEAANIFFLAVSTTSIATDIYTRSQYFSSTCACRQLPATPSNLTAQVASGAAGAQVNLQWTPAADATSYQVEVVQPALAPIDTNNPVPGFMAAGVPNGQYRVQVRAVNPLGTSSPSNVVDVVVGSSAPCVTPAAPSSVNGALISDTATVSWSPVPGATSYIVRAGSAPGGSDLFNGNVGNTTAVSASGLPPGFRAFVRVSAASACGTSGASAEVLIGS
jgi:hypothetical protein